MSMLHGSEIVSPGWSTATPLPVETVVERFRQFAELNPKMASTILRGLEERARSGHLAAGEYWQPGFDGEALLKSGAILMGREIPPARMVRPVGTRPPEDVGV
ncbi:hypothetical protein [Zavarzinia sp.]|uniref:hypothetical protein n=1 Tax=Zavarzinia sp. TaxID=2027920 RepID=UPI003BB504FC